MTVSLSRHLLLLLVFLAGNAAYGATATPAPPHEIAPSLDKIEAGEGAGYEEAPPAAVTVAPIEKPSADGFGTLSETNGGLPNAIWQGSTHAQDDFLLSLIDSGVANATLRDLLVKLLMTQSQPPAGTSNNDWLELRVRSLANLGQDAKAIEMISALPASIAKPQLTQLLIEIELAQGSYDKVCKQPQPDVHSLSSPEAIFWQKVNILCQAHAGKNDEAMVGLDVLHETNADEGLFFQEAVRHMGDKNIPLKSYPKSITLFDFAVIKLAGETDKLRDKFDMLPPLAIKYIAEDAGIDIKLREKATAVGQQAGIMQGTEVGKMAEQPFAKSLASDVNSLVSALESGNPPTDSDNAVIARLDLDNVAIQDARRLQRLLSCMEVFGYTVSDSVWQKLFVRKNRFDGEIPPAMLLDRLDQASNTHHKAQVILLASLLTGSNEVYKVSDTVLIPVIRALKSAGFEKEARQIAFTAVKSYK